MSSATQYLKALATRRTIYALKPELPTNVSIAEIQDVIQAIIRDTPTCFNSQGSRAIILTGETHKKVWSQVVASIPDDYGKKRTATIRDEAYGSVIFFSDDVTTEKLETKFPAWAAIMPQFADHSSGAAQIHSWTALELLGLGANLQHYNGYVKAALGDEVPAEWKVQAQLVFGLPAAAAGEKTFEENVVKVLA